MPKAPAKNVVGSTRSRHGLPNTHCWLIGVQLTTLYLSSRNLPKAINTTSWQLFSIDHLGIYCTVRDACKFKFYAEVELSFKKYISFELNACVIFIIIGLYTEIGGI